jgi:hypothetical protein
MSRKNAAPSVTEGSLLPAPVFTGIIYLQKGKKGRVYPKGYIKSNLYRKQGLIGK